MKLMNQIDPNNKTEKCILIGRGNSIDKLDFHKLNTQNTFDICTINDAIKVIKNPKFSFFYDLPGIVRNYSYLVKTDHLLIPSYKYRKFLIKHPNLSLTPLHNIYLFDIDTENNYITLKNWAFTNSRCKNNQLFNRCTSVSGAFNFLAGYMQYKEIYYIGFDNTLSYSKLVSHERCFGEENNIIIKYKRGWKGILEMLKYYPHQKFTPLRFYLK